MARWNQLHERPESLRFGQARAWKKPGLLNVTAHRKETSYPPPLVDEKCSEGLCVVDFDCTNRKKTSPERK